LRITVEHRITSDFTGYCTLNRYSCEQLAELLKTDLTTLSEALFLALLRRNEPRSRDNELPRSKRDRGLSLWLLGARRRSFVAQFGLRKRQKNLWDPGNEAVLQQIVRTPS